MALKNSRRTKRVKSHKTKKSRKASPYNKFMKTEIPKVKKANPKMDHKTAFKQAAKNWSAQKKK